MAQFETGAVGTMYFRARRRIFFGTGFQSFVARVRAEAEGATFPSA